MKDILKSRVFAFVLGAIIFGGIGVASAIIYQSKDVIYTPTETTWEVDNVKDALDDLYINASKFKTMTIGLQARSWSTSSESSALLDFSPFVGIYKYFKVINLTNTSLRSCLIYRWDKNAQAEFETVQNVEYSLDNNANVYLNVVNDNNTYGTCMARVLLYN